MMLDPLVDDPLKNGVLDFVGGREDLDAKIIRAIGDPEHRFGEDKLRMLRAVRFAARFDYTIEPDTFRAIQKLAPQIRSGLPGACARRADPHAHRGPCAPSFSTAR